jgi:DNA-binding NarL/FixJ family response regulator
MTTIHSDANDGDPDNDVLRSLSQREIALLRLVAQGQSSSEIANALSLSSNTVRAHLYSIYGKLGVTSRSEAARIASEMGL